MSQPHIDVRRQAFRLLHRHPLEWLDALRAGFATLKARYLLRCIGPGTIVGGRTHIVNFSNVRIGSGCLVQDHVYMRAGGDGHIRLGDGVAINSFAKLFGHGGIDIGSHSQIGPGALLTTTTHDTDDAMSATFHPISIGEWCWIGANATILSGVRIGDRCVVGAGSLVNRDLPDHCVAVGVPARVIKRTAAAPDGVEQNGAAASSAIVDATSAGTSNAVSTVEPA